MLAVIFEVAPRPDQWDAYLAHAADLRPALLGMDGFLDNRRFRNRVREGWLLSLSLWRDEQAVRRWREHEGHHAVQVAGRQSVFQDYHLRVGEAIAVDGAPTATVGSHATAVGASRVLSVIEAPTAPAPSGTLEATLFDGITVPGSTLMLLGWADETAALSHRATLGDRRLDVRIARDYGLRDRREAPQFRAPVEPGA